MKDNLFTMPLGNDFLKIDDTQIETDMCCCGIGQALLLPIFSKAFPHRLNCFLRNFNGFLIKPFKCQGRTFFVSA